MAVARLCAIAALFHCSDGFQAHRSPVPGSRVARSILAPRPPRFAPKQSPLTVIAAMSTTPSAGPISSGDAVKEVLTGVVIALAGIPASIAFANIAGVNPLVGIWSSVILGLVSAVVGGSPGLIAGAAGVVAVPLAPLIANHGVAYMGPCVLLAAALELCVGALGLGKFVRVVDDNVMNGFLNGLGCLLFKSQLAVFAGLAGASLYATLGVAALTAAVTKFLPLLTTAVPSSLVAVVASAALAPLLPLLGTGASVKTLADVAGAGTFQGGLAVLPRFAPLQALGPLVSSTPSGVAWLATLKIVLPTALSVALISVLETLLAGKVLAAAPQGLGMARDEGRTLLGLGAGKAASAVLGGFGGCGLIPQCLLAIQSAGPTGRVGPLTALSCSAATCVLVVGLAPLIGSVPLASVAGVMLTVAAATVQVDWTFQSLKRALGTSSTSGSSGSSRARLSFLTLAVTSAACYFVDMAAGIGLGVAMNWLFLSKKS